MKYIILFLALVSVALCNDIYVANSAAGQNTGKDALNAHSAAWFNTNKVSSGDTVHLCGIISTELVNPTPAVTILFEKDARLSKPYWNAVALTINTPNVVVDGGVNGIIECTANGTGLTNQKDCIGVYIDSASGVTVKNLTIRNIYVRIAGSEQNGFGAGIFFNSNNAAISNATADNCIISNASNGIVSNFAAGSSNFVFSNNTVSYCNWSINAGDRGHATDSLTGLVITGNNLSQWANWNDTANNSFHHNGVFIFANQGTCVNPIVANNFFGSGLGGSYQTSYIYENTGILDPLVFNNVFAPGLNEGASNGAVVVSSQRATTLTIVNNTFVQNGNGGPGIATTGFSPGQTLICQNNLFVGNWYYNVSLYGNSFLKPQFNHSLYYNTQHFSVGAGFETMQAWQSFGYDRDALTADPLLDANYIPASGSPVQGKGVNLSSLGVPLINSDKAGKPRGTAWDIGAYNAGGSLPPVVIPPVVVPPIVVPPPTPPKITGSVSTTSADGKTITTVITFDKSINP